MIFWSKHASKEYSHLARVFATVIASEPYINTNRT